MIGHFFFQLIFGCSGDCEKGGKTYDAGEKGEQGGRLAGKGTRREGGEPEKNSVCCIRQVNAKNWKSFGGS